MIEKFINQEKVKGDFPLFLKGTNGKKGVFKKSYSFFKKNDNEFSILFKDHGPWTWQGVAKKKVTKSELLEFLQGVEDLKKGE